MNYLFYDLETSGLNKQFDQIFQFAAIKTDAEFNQIGEPIEFFCKLRADVLPHPQAVKVNRINVRELEEKGLTEFEFAKRVSEVLLGNEQQIVVGYNSSSFDNEMVRFLLYRNLLDPYEWEWQHNNSCLDLYSVMCLGYSFDRLGGILAGESGAPDSLKLEDLSRFNGFEHANAHDAVSDVRATVDLAKLLRARAPLLLDFSLSLSDREKVRRIVTGGDAFFQSNSVYGYDSRFLGLNRYICPHPTNRNSLISWKLGIDPLPILELSTEEVRDQMFAKKLDRMLDVGFEEVRVNKRPAIVPYSEKECSRIVNHDIHLKNGTAVQENLPRLIEIANGVFASAIPSIELDANLYQGDYFREVDADRVALTRFRNEPLSVMPSDFKSIRFQRLSMRVRARSFPESLDDAGRAAFRDFRRRKFEQTDSDKWLTGPAFETLCENALEDPDLSEVQRDCLMELIAFVEARDTFD